MSTFRRLIAAAIGLALPLAVAATAAEAAPHRPAHVRSATYKVAQHKAARHHRTSAAARHLAQAHRHTNMRGS